MTSDPTNPDDKEWRALRRSKRKYILRKIWKERCMKCRQLFDCMYHLQRYCPNCRDTKERI